MKTPEKILAKLLRPEGVTEAKFEETEAEFLSMWENARNDPIIALSRIGAFAMTVPRKRGLEALLRSDANGWRELERWYVLETLSSHLIGPHMAYNAPIFLGHALTLGESRAAGWLAADLEARMKRSASAYEGQLLPSFLLHLHRVYAPGSSAGPGAIPELGEYAAVFAAWDDVDALGRALADVCIRRLQVVAAQGNSEVAEFRFAPLLPVDIAAVQRIRADRGEPVPVVSHPLMNTPLANIPRTRSYDPTDDPWYLRTIESGVAAGRIEPDFVW